MAITRLIICVVGVPSTVLRREHQKIRREDARGGVRVEKRDAVRRMDWTNPTIASDRSANLSATLSSVVCSSLHLDVITSDVLRCSRPLVKPSSLAYLAFLTGAAAMGVNEVCGEPKT